MSLPKVSKVSSSTDSDPSDEARFDLAYWHTATSRVQRLLERQSSLERLLASNVVELRGALARQTEAYCSYRSSFLPTFPVLSDGDITSVLGLDFKALGDLAGDLALKVLQPSSTGQTSAITAAVTAAAATPIILSRRFTKKRSVRPVCQKPAKKFAPSSKTGDDLPTSTI
jgi:hypothetical protein